MTIDDTNQGAAPARRTWLRPARLKSPSAAATAPEMPTRLATDLHPPTILVPRVFRDLVTRHRTNVATAYHLLRRTCEPGVWTRVDKHLILGHRADPVISELWIRLNGKSLGVRIIYDGCDLLATGTRLVAIAPVTAPETIKRAVPGEPLEVAFKLPDARGKANVILSVGSGPSDDILKLVCRSKIHRLNVDPEVDRSAYR